MTGAGTAAEILAEALRRPDADRAGFLDHACGGRSGLRRELEELIAIAAEAGSFMAQPAAGGLDRAEPAPDGGDETAERLVPGSRLGSYVIVREIASGGMGTVHLAEQSEPIRRRVAIKVIKPGLDTRLVIERFEQERRTLARLGHPNVAVVLEAGETRRGRPYFVMELVEGEPITAYARRRSLDVEARIRLLLDACAGVQHAHRRGIIHRDLKPGNVLVTEIDGRPVPKIIDFGIAKALTDDETGHAMTLHGQRIGTPGFMAPEQRRGDAAIDTRADVWALGVILAGLLTDRLPFDDEPGDGTLHETRVLPLSRLVTDSARARRLRGDLDWIVRRCLESDPEHRYGSVESLARDLERHLAGTVIEAGPPSRWRRLRSLARRHRLALTAAAAVMVSLASGLGVALAALSREHTAAIAARAAEGFAARDAHRASVAGDFLRNTFERIDPEVAGMVDTTLLRSMLDDAAARLGSELAEEPLVGADMSGVVGLAYAAIGAPTEAEPHLRRALRLDRELLDPDDPETLRVVGGLVRVLKDLGRHEEAVPLAESNLAATRRVHGAEHAETLAAANNLGTVLLRAQRLQEAERVLRELLETKRRVLAADDASIVVTLSNLGTAVADQGRHDEAAVLRAEQLEAARAVHGDEHPRTLIAMNNLAFSLDRIGRPEEALTLYERAVPLAEAIHGPDHMMTLAAMNNLAAHRRDAGRPDLAEPVLVELVERATRTLGDDHLYAIAFRKNLAELRLETGRPSEAEAIAAAAQASAWRTLPDGHPLRGLTLVVHARVLDALDRQVEAIALLEKDLPTLRDERGEDDPFGAASLLEALRVAK